VHALGWLDDPKILRRFHGAATLGWAVMIPVSMATGLRNSVPYLVGISVWALVAGHAAAYAGARAEASNGDDVHIADLTDEQYDRLRDRILDAIRQR